MRCTGANALAHRIHRDSQTSTGVLNGPKVFTSIVAKYQSPCRPTGKGKTRLEALQVGEVEMEPNPLLRNALLEQQMISHRLVHGDKAADAGKW